jgi:hypothetical protein
MPPKGDSAAEESPVFCGEDKIISISGLGNARLDVICSYR